MSSLSLDDLLDQVLSFRAERDWQQFHTPKDVALSLCLEAAEVLELMQWRNGEQLEAHLREHRGELADELADVLYWVLLLAHDQQIDLGEAMSAKLAANAAKYPVEQFRGSHRKYTES